MNCKFAPPSPSGRKILAHRFMVGNGMIRNQSTFRDERMAGWFCQLGIIKALSFAPGGADRPLKNALPTAEAVGYSSVVPRGDFQILVALGLRPAVEGGILPPGDTAEGLDYRVFSSVPARQDAQLDGRRDARRYSRRFPADF